MKDSQPAPANKILGLPGFLGSSEDFSIFSDDLSITGADLFSPHSKLSPNNLSDWGESIAAKCNECGYELLLGYSLGARLALHAALSKTASFKALILVSAHLGIVDEEERCARSKSDKTWAARFLEEEWGSLIEAWNSQAIFSGAEYPTERREADFSRQHLSDALVLASLARQENLFGRLDEITCPILWIVGENDARFLNQALKLQSSSIQVSVVENAGHRAPWEKPQEFKQIVSVFLSRNLSF